VGNWTNLKVGVIARTMDVIKTIIAMMDAPELPKGEDAPPEA